jgi:Ca-activated chloride channel family protein
MMSIAAGTVGKPVEDLTPQTFRDDQSVQAAILGLERKSDAIPDSTEAMLADLRRADADGALHDYVSAVPMSENMVFAYNHGTVLTGNGTAATPKEPLAALYPTDGTLLQTIPFVPVNTRVSPARTTAIEAFQQALLGGAGRNAFTAAGLRTPDGSNPALTPEAGFSPDLRGAPTGTAKPAATAAALALFRGVHQRGTTLTAIDTSGSMKNPVTGGDSRTRLQVAVAAFQAAVTSLADDSDMGLWQFALNLEGATDYRQLVPIGPVGQLINGVSRREQLITASSKLTADKDTGLYDTALAAFRTLTTAYTPGRPNQVVLFTDGKNDKKGGISLDDLVTALKQEFNADRPVHLITIAYGDDVDISALQRISAATGAKTYPARDATSISTVIIDVLTSH